MIKRETTIKLQDTSALIGTDSRLEDYWKKQGFEDFYTKFRTGSKLPANITGVTSLEKILSIYKINSVGFGNWVTQEDRFNYISALNIALYDIDKILGFDYNIGLFQTISFSFGARGQGGALAHFETTTFIINVTRYKAAGSSKQRMFLHTGGAGSVAHEYGHALDYYFGTFREYNKELAPALSGGNTTKTRYEKPKTNLRAQMCELLDAIIWETPYKETSNYYKRLKANFEGDYMFRRNEIFARCFEKYIQFKLQKKGIVNMFLNEPKYDPRAYPTDTETAAIVPLFDKLIKGMKGKL